MSNQSFDLADRATLMAALTFYKLNGQGEPSNRTEEIQELATDGGRDTSLNDEGLDDLIDRIAASNIFAVPGGTAPSSDSTQVDVHHWDSPMYGGAGEHVQGTMFKMDIWDHRGSGGQAQVTLTKEDEDGEDQLSVAFEVSSLVEGGPHLPTARIYIGDEVALSFYKQPTGYLLESGGDTVQLNAATLPNGASGWSLTAEQ